MKYIYTPLIYSIWYNVYENIVMVNFLSFQVAFLNQWPMRDHYANRNRWTLFPETQVVTE